MSAKKLLTSFSRLPAGANVNLVTALPAVFAAAVGARPHQPESDPVKQSGHADGSVRNDQSARGAGPGIHVTKTEVPRSGHR